MDKSKVRDTINYIDSLAYDRSNQAEVKKARKIAKKQKRSQNSSLIKTDKKKLVKSTFKQKFFSRVWQLARSGLSVLTSLLLVHRKDLHGTAYIDPFLKTEATNLASLLTFTNLWNIITTSSIIFVGFKPFGFYDLPGLMMNVLALSILNVTGKGAVSGFSDKNRLNRNYLGIYIGMNVVLTFVGGIGSEIMLNRYELARIKAHSLAMEVVIEPRQEKLNQLKGADEISIIEKFEQECNSRGVILKEKLDRFPAGTQLPSGLDNEFYELYGFHEDRGKSLEDISYGNKNIEQWPICPQYKQRRSIHNEKIRSAEEELLSIKDEVTKENALHYLKNNENIIYGGYFDDEGLINAPLTEISVATNLWKDKFLTLQFSDLGFTLFMFVVSFITSVGSVRLMINYSRLEEFKLSWCNELREVTNEWFWDIRNTLIEAENSTVRDLEIYENKNNGNGHNKQTNSLDDLKIEP